ncbi:BlaI/MecI/CopY family transcriptional regulator [Knoellia sp. Soil729]|uniref:BlaI/MecI/CopY family transcriptional regulator n=1 Tax=Knoellia sp. Soil729 TaxID=1736394 RepID=UPI0007013B9D|nr:BlaI/MecI/CopY family transcriptional regulator [Knoellia sp. Soil729]KRE42632.1 CopY family transcriptional regulator [Knoellia sp. Soil729]
MPHTSSAPRLGDLERTLMEQLWDSAAHRPDGASVREVLEALPAERGLAYTTVMTVLDRLSKKGLVTRERDGRAWRYTPAGTRESLTAETMRATLDDASDRRATLLHFLDGATPEELDDLRAALSEVEQRRG